MAFCNPLDGEPIHSGPLPARWYPGTNPRQLATQEERVDEKVNVLVHRT
jgi:hypothetical protein